MPLNLLPPDDVLFNSADELQQQIQTHAKDQGYAISILRSRTNKHKEVKLYFFQCVKGGKPRDRVKDTRFKPFVSQKTECPFRCQGRRNPDGIWQLTVTNSNHNHDPEAAIFHWQHRFLPTWLHDQVTNMTKANILPKQIAISLRYVDPNQLFTMQDIYNIRKVIRIEQLAGKTPIEAMLYELQKSNYIYEYQLDQQRHITHLFFAHPTSIELLKRYLDVVLMDCTYKMN
jgi:hypothetical protein